ncbi:MAG: hypothetical protein NVSMB22_22700 [Chloroflexota bacterium]
MPASTVLFVCPDYVSHFFPLQAVAEACARRGHRILVATGPGLEPRVKELGWEYACLVLGPGNNTGVLQKDANGTGQEGHMRAFFDATRQGLLATLRYQSLARQHDMLHDPRGIYRRLNDILQEVQPTWVLVDQLSFSATLALHALRTPFVSFHPGNPAALPTPGRYFGLPHRVPEVLGVAPADLATLEKVCRDTAQRFTDAFNAVLRDLPVQAPLVDDAFRFTSPWLTLINYPQALAHRPFNGHTVYLGSCLRSEPPDAAFDDAVRALPQERATVYLSFGSFLSARDDVLNRVLAALRSLEVNVILASGSGTIETGKSAPHNWIIRSVIPQLAALRSSDLVISHGGNNTLTEALALGVPLLIGPFSSDQFDSAADVEAAGVGDVFAPNSVQPEELSAQVRRMLRDSGLKSRVDQIASTLRRDPGGEKAADALESLAPQLRANG